MFMLGVNNAPPGLRYKTSGAEHGVAVTKRGSVQLAAQQKC